MLNIPCLWTKVALLGMHSHRLDKLWSLLTKLFWSIFSCYCFLLLFGNLLPIQNNSFQRPKHPLGIQLTKTSTPATRPNSTICSESSNHYTGTLISVASSGFSILSPVLTSHFLPKLRGQQNFLGSCCETSSLRMDYICSSTTTRGLHLQQR